MKHKKLWIFLFTALFLFALTSCGSGRSKIYNTNTLQTSTEFGFTDGGDARVTVSYFGYESTEDANIHIKIEKQGFFIFWNTVIDQDFEANGQNYQNEFFYPITDNGKYRCTVTYTIFGAEEDDVIVFKDEKTYQKEDFHAEATDTSEASVTESTPTETTTAETTTEETSTAETTTEETTTAEPPESEEAKALRLRYEAAVEAMNEYLANDSGDMETLKYLYHEFEALCDYEDSETYFSRFTTLPDMLTSIVLTKTNANGKISEAEFGHIIYNKYGQGHYAWGDDLDILPNFIRSDETAYSIEQKAKNTMIVISPNAPITSEGAFYSFNENKKLYRIANYDISSLAKSYPLEYPAGNQTFYYSYNEQGELIKKECKSLLTGHRTDIENSYSDTYKITETWNYQHTYDENGHIMQTITLHNCSYEQEHLYWVEVKYPSTINHTVAGETRTWNDPTTKTIRNYTTDENGRILSAEIIDESKPNTEQHLTYHYETLYFYQK